MTFEPLVVEFDVAAPAAHAFDVWANRTALWWPPGHTMSGGPQAIVFEPEPGGRIFERTANGEELPWGEVLDWNPPRRLRYLWHLFFDRAEATEVDVTFTERGAGTLVRIEQSGWERLGAAGESRRERNHQGWAAVTSHYRRVVAAA